MTREGHNGYFQIQCLLPKLVLRLGTMYKTCGQDNTEILHCVRTFKLCERKAFELRERKL